MKIKNIFGNRKWSYVKILHYPQFFKEMHMSEYVAVMLGWLRKRWIIKSHFKKRINSSITQKLGTSTWKKIIVHVNHHWFQVKLSKVSLGILKKKNVVYHLSRGESAVALHKNKIHQHETKLQSMWATISSKQKLSKLSLGTQTILGFTYSTILSYQEYRHHSTTSALKSNGTLSAKALVSNPLIEN